MPQFGLIGKNIAYSFSKSYFNTKFQNGQLPYSYETFDIDNITGFPEILKNNKQLKGLNVTIPYKEQIIPYLDELNSKAQKIGAVNVIKILPDGKLKGYNTDAYGFEASIKPLLKPNHTHALILGNGGASKAVAYALKKLNISIDYVVRTPSQGAKFLYSDLTENIIKSYPVIVNCTPVGTFPDVNNCPDIPYDGITKNHLLYDLIYNPIQTKFLVCGEEKGATTCNGYDMLVHQAEKAWKIWQKP